MFRKTETGDKRTSLDHEGGHHHGDHGAVSVTGDEVIAFIGKGVEFKGVITYNGTVRIVARIKSAPGRASRWEEAASWRRRGKRVGLSRPRVGG